MQFETTICVEFDAEEISAAGQRLRHFLVALGEAGADVRDAGPVVPAHDRDDGGGWTSYGPPVE